MSKLDSYCKKLYQLSKESKTHGSYQKIRECRRRMELILNFIKGRNTLLDIGCNSGILTLLLANNIKSVEGVEPVVPLPSKQTLEENNINNCIFHSSNFKDFSDEFNKKYDVVLALAVNYHINKHDKISPDDIVTKYLNFLNENGIIIIETHAIGNHFKNRVSEHKEQMEVDKIVIDLLKKKCDIIKILDSNRKHRQIYIFKK